MKESNFEIPVIITDTPDILTTHRTEQGLLGTIVTKLYKIIKKYGKQRVEKKKVISKET